MIPNHEIDPRSCRRWLRLGLTGPLGNPELRSRISDESGVAARLPGRKAAARLVGFVAVLSCLTLGFSGLAAASARASSAPGEVVTEPAEATASGVKLRGRLNPNGLPTTYYFEYGRVGWGECSNCTTKTALGGPLSGENEQEVPAVEVTGLEEGEYWYHLVATNEEGTVEAESIHFTGVPSPRGSAPGEVVTEPSEATANGVVLRGRLNPNGLPTTYYFEYGQFGWNECSNCTTKTALGGPLSGDTEQEVPAVEVNGLGSGLYWDRLVATNADGTAEGESVRFTVPEPISTPPSGGENGPGGQGGQASIWEPPTPVLTPPPTASPIQTTQPEASTGAHKLARALRACRHGSKGQRALCARQARRKYALAAARAGRQASHGKN